MRGRVIQLKRSGFRYFMIIVSVCGMAAATIGLITNIAGLFFTPVAEEFSVLRGSVSMTVTICNIVMAIGGIATSKLLTEKTLRPMIILAGVVSAGATALLGITSGIVSMYILNALRGFAGGMLSFVFITVIVNNWFRKNVALITSIALGCSGIAGALFSPIVSGIIDSLGWRSGYFAVGGIMLLLFLPSMFFIPCIDPHTRSFTAYGEEEKTSRTSVLKETGLPDERKADILLFIMCVTYTIFINILTALPQHFPGVAESYGVNSSTGVTMLSFSMIANSAGKIMLGALIDRIGTRKAVSIFSVFVAAGTALLFIRQDMIMITGAVLFGLVYSLAAVAPVELTKDSFGLELYTKTYPVISMTGTISNAVFSAAVGFINDMTHGYNEVLMMMGTGIVGAFMMVLFMYRRISHKK